MTHTVKLLEMKITSTKKPCLNASLKEGYLADSIWQTPSQKWEGNMNKEEQSNKVGKL